jgi:hypothetical protein
MFRIEELVAVDWQDLIFFIQSNGVLETLHFRTSRLRPQLGKAQSE